LRELLTDERYGSPGGAGQGSGQGARRRQPY
jgi:hypothetical protein